MEIILTFGTFVLLLAIIALLVLVFEALSRVCDLLNKIIEKNGKD